jgi:endonuclease/exonuclease/phosphatase family metal-dependent hydrolase
VKERRSALSVAVVASLGLTALPVAAQILLSAGSYHQNFDSLGGANAGWTNNVTLSGWYASKGGGNATNFFAGNGGSTAGGIYSFGVSGVGSSVDRAFGSLGASSINYAYGLRLTNDTSVAQTGFTISYTGEQWRSGSTANPHALSFAYQIGSGPFTNAHSGTWTAFEMLNFISPNLAGSQAALDGNAATNRQSFTSIALTGVTLPPGQELFLRWLDVDDTGFDHGLALDDLTISFSAVTSAPPTANAAFSVLTYNTHGNHIEDWTTNSPQVRAIGRQMQYLQPDIVTFQEIPFTNTHEMVNFVVAFLPGYQLATNSGTDGFIRSVILSRFPITRSQKWLDGADLAPFGYTAANFTRDLFEAQIAVPGFPQPLHVFTTHLKAGTSDSDDAARRAAEASAISNFFVTAYLTTNALHPYLLTGDLNEDIAIPATGSQQPIQRMTNGTGLFLTTPLNPFSGGGQTFSIRAALSRRYDYILPNGLLFSNLVSSQVFRTDLLANPPAPLLTDDDVTASDHLPVLMTFANPFDQPFRLVSATRSNSTMTLAWQAVPGQFYCVESSSNLAIWTALTIDLLATNPAFTYRTNLLDNQRFFRVHRVP